MKARRLRTVTNMPSFRPHWRLPALLIWTLQTLLPVCRGTESLRITLENTVFVAFTGEDLRLPYKLHLPPNSANESLICFDPLHRRIFRRFFTSDVHAQTFSSYMLVRALQTSGEYHCQCNVARAYWFVRLRDEGYKDVLTVDYTDFVTVGFFSAALLLLSVVGSVYVFRGTWKTKVPECGNPSPGGKQKKEVGVAETPDHDNTDAKITSSTSLYATLEPRPGSVYDVLNVDSQDRKPGLKPKTGQKLRAQSPQAQDQGVFESVYENF
ncbi:uncharacterized protein si:ch211-243a20.4 [Entelurus aequoreus]|uniref:uncharacterized protein si:ch211-243a20.4 n=1 Tax=Entelurus aequoreus TaxID=161455 RepID=UPI002B1D7272|nr:uncharacterized protein si:ch211-243a20.4 [Entelurus aequoreus]